MKFVLNLISKLKIKVRYKLLYYFIAINSLENIVSALRIKLTKKKLVFNREHIDYIFHSHNNMGLTERTVELGLAKNYLKKYKPRFLLEIGNVTNYYYSNFIGLIQNKTVVDLGETDFMVIKKDIAQYQTEKKFDFILSISTFEHMDEEGFKPANFNYSNNTVAAQNIIYCYENLLENGGCMLLTAALGWTPEWDRTFKSDILNKHPFNKIQKYLLRRINEQEWVQINKIDIDETPYGIPYDNGNWLSVIEINK